MEECGCEVWELKSKDGFKLFVDREPGLGLELVQTEGNTGEEHASLFALMTGQDPDPDGYY